MSQQSGLEGPTLSLAPAGESHFRFKISNHCGHLKIGNQQYFIMPKLGEGYLNTMLQSFVEGFKRVFSGNFGVDSSTETFDELIAHLFIGNFDANLKGRLRQGYIQESVRNYRGAGRLSVGGSIDFIYYGSRPPLWEKTRWTRNTDLNKSLRTLFYSLASRLQISQRTRSNLLEIASECADESLSGHLDFQNILTTLDRTQEQYRPILELASVLNTHLNLSDGVYKSYTLLFPSWLLFEGACRNELRKGLKQFAINDKNSFGLRVSVDSSNRLEPDLVVIDRENNYKFIGDCKYVLNESLGLKRDHLFQLNAYMSGYDVSVAYILYPGISFDRKLYRLNWGKSIEVIQIPCHDHDSFSLSLKDLAESIEMQHAFRKELA